MVYYFISNTVNGNSKNIILITYLIQLISV